MGKTTLRQKLWNENYGQNREYLVYENDRENIWLLDILDWKFNSKNLQIIFQTSSEHISAPCQAYFRYNPDIFLVISDTFQTLLVAFQTPPDCLSQILSNPLGGRSGGRWICGWADGWLCGLKVTILPLLAQLGTRNFQEFNSN